MGIVQSMPTWGLRLLWHLPAVVVLGVYLPASLFGAYAFRDTYAFALIALLPIFALSYYLLYPRFSRLFGSATVRSWFWRIGKRVNWQLCAWTAALIYVATIAIATYTTRVSPLGAAIGGASLMDIAHARGEFLAKREGFEAILRYAAVILGRSVVPFLITYAYWSEHRLRHIALLALLACYGVSLEKASPLFVFLPLILLRSVQGRWRAAGLHVAALLVAIALFTFLAMGGLHNPGRATPASDRTSSATPSRDDSSPQAGSAVQRHGDPRRHSIFNLAPALGVWPSARQPNADDPSLWMINRVVWVPYITAYDWLKFQDDVLDGRPTLGRSIGIVSWLLGKPRLQLEQMVYAYEFGESPGGAGASNTVFFVDAKLAFGWPGAIFYCLIFPLFAAAVFSSENDVAKVASVTSFFTAALSPLTATLLSGGLAFYIAISLLARTRLDAPAAKGFTGNARTATTTPSA
jgi:hypothetical protein